MLVDTAAARDFGVWFCSRHYTAPQSYFSSAVAMESNKDEAERCIEISLAALRDNRPDKARRFLEKAQKLFPTQKAQRESIVLHER